MTSLFRYNLLLAVGWCALLGELSVPNLVVGFLVGFLALSISGPMFRRTRYFTSFLRYGRLALYFAVEFFRSSMLVAWDVLTPKHKSRPAIVAIPLDLEHPLQITTLANLLSLTPGTLSLDVSPDRKTLYVHAMFVRDPEETRLAIKNGLERLVKEAMR
ncbi:MAG: Na+/H+ antiporter subunit E [Bryobacterales bacterium]|nr:Na+/H+ antiporter subunit E [Bryobacterales bacterium]